MYKVCKGYNFENPISIHETYEEAITALQSIGKIVLMQSFEEYNYFAVGEKDSYAITKIDVAS